MSEHSYRTLTVRVGWIGIAWLLMANCAPGELANLPIRQRPPRDPEQRVAIPPSAEPAGVEIGAQGQEPPEAGSRREELGLILRTSYPGRLVEDDLPLVIFLPPGHQTVDGRLPTIYLLHGLRYDHQHWMDLGASAYARQAIQSGRWPPLALVMPYMPEPLFSSTDGGPGSYEEELRSGLLPFVESQFSLGAPRAIAGISRGGVWALEIAFRAPTDFVGAAALSPALNLNFARPRYDPLWLADQSAAVPSRVYLAAGDREPEIRQATESLAEVLEAVGATFVLEVNPGGHDNDTWASTARVALDYLVEAFR